MNKILDLIKFKLVQKMNKKQVKVNKKAFTKNIYSGRF